MSKSAMKVPLPVPVLRDAQPRAARDGVSVENSIGRSAEKSVREAYIRDKYFSRRPQPGDVDRMMEILDKAGDNPPGPGDELP